MKYKKDEICYIIENNIKIVPVKILKYSSEFYTVKLLSKAGAIRLKEHRIFATEEEARKILGIDRVNIKLEATKNNLSGLQVLECGSKIITTPNGLYTLKGDLPEGRSYVAHVINGDYNANSAEIRKVIIQNNGVIVQFAGAVNSPCRINYVIFSVPN